MVKSTHLADVADALDSGTSLANPLFEISTQSGISSTYSSSEFVSSFTGQISSGSYARYLPDLLAEAVAKSRSWADLCRRFNKKPDTGSLSYIKNKVKKFGIDCQHLDTYNRYTPHVLAEAVARSKCWREVCEHFEISPDNSGTHSYLIERARDWGINFTHFRGKGWAAKERGGIGKIKKPVVEYLVVDGPKMSQERLKRLLITAGLKEDECEWCGVAEWLGEKLSLELDHINMNRRDLRFENLQLLCPNCHSIKTNADMGVRPLPKGYTVRGPIRSTKSSPSEPLSLELVLA